MNLKQVLVERTNEFFERHWRDTQIAQPGILTGSGGAELGVNRLATIGFPADYGYLAPALEDYLIERLNPPANRVGKRGK
tara:strand:- start:1926 stop:2165 length:240 start_codon:yes stop_codon:yes gene_type:complete